MSDGTCVIPPNPPPNSAVKLARIVRYIHMADDLLALVIAYFLTYRMRFDLSLTDILLGNLDFGSQYARVYAERSWVYLGLMFAFLFVPYAVLGMYDGHRRIRRTPILWNAIVANGFVIGCVAVYLFFSKSSWHMRGFLPLVLMVNIPVAFLVRYATNCLITAARRKYPSLRAKALLIGFNNDAETICKWAAEGRMKGCDVVQRIASPQSLEEARRKLPALLATNISVVFIMDREMPLDVIMDIIRMSAKHNKTVKAFFPRFLTLHNPYISGDMIEGIPLVHFSAPEFSDADKCFRRIGARMLAAVFLVLLSPLFLLVSVLIRLDCSGPAMFIQDRFGRNGTSFKMLKFRTMCKDAECRIDELRAHNEADGALFKMRNDPRVTRIGRLLRKTSIDELPQIINILRGEMRFVGPRPLPVRDLVDYTHTWHFMRQMAAPGITCIWQVAGRSGIGFEDMCLLDIWYISNRDWILDVRILYRTVWVVLFGHGAY